MAPRCSPARPHGREEHDVGDPKEERPAQMVMPAGCWEVKPMEGDPNLGMHLLKQNCFSSHIVLSSSSFYCILQSI